MGGVDLDSMPERELERLYAGLVKLASLDEPVLACSPCGAFAACYACITCCAVAGRCARAKGLARAISPSLQAPSIPAGWPLSVPP